MALISVPFTSFAPDFPDLNNPGLIRAHNCTASRGATQGSVTLSPLKAASLYSDTAMESRPRGSAIGQDRDGNARVYAGSAAKLYKLAPSTRQWTDITRASGPYASGGNERWKSVEFGNLQIFTNMNDAPQVIDINVDLQFADLTTLVKGRHINTHKGFTILGNTYDALDGAVPYRVRWSGIENPSSWDFSSATMADFQDIQGFGAVQGIVTDDSCYVLLQRGIVQMQFIGAPYVFQFENRVVGKGCSVPESVITVQGMHFFLSDDGFYCLQNGQLQQIGSGRIDKWFLETADLSQAHLITTAIDPRETLVYWQFVSKDSESGKPDMMLIYNYASGEWATADATTNFIFNSVSLPWTIEQLDTFGTLDLIPASPDDPIWSGGKAMLWGMSDTGKVYSFSGKTLELSIETPEFQLSKNFSNETAADISRIDAVRPLFNGDATGRIRVGTRALQNSPDVQWSDLTETHPETGFAYTRQQSRYQRIRLTLAGDWEKAFGIEIEGRVVGKR